MFLSVQGVVRKSQEARLVSNREFIKIIILFVIVVGSYFLLFDKESTDEIEEQVNYNKEENKSEISYIDQLPSETIQSDSFSRYIYSFYHNPVNIGFKKFDDPTEKNSQESDDLEKRAENKILEWYFVVEEDNKIALSKEKKSAMFLFIPSLSPPKEGEVCIFSSHLICFLLSQCISQSHFLLEKIYSLLQFFYTNIYKQIYF